MALTATEEIKIREIIEWYYNLLATDKELSETDVISQINTAIAAISQGAGTSYATRAAAMAENPLPADDTPFIVIKEPGFNGQYAYDSTQEFGYILVTLFKVSTNTITENSEDNATSKAVFAHTAPIVSGLNNKADKGNYNGTLETLNDKVDALSFDGAETVDTYADLPTSPVPANGTTKKVANDPDSNKNGEWYVSAGAWVQNNSSKTELNKQEQLKTAINLSASTQELTTEYDTSKEVCNIHLDSSFTLGETSLREHCFFYYPPNDAMYMLADILPLSNPNHPNTYDSEIGLFKANDDTLVNWTYLGVCIEKGGVGELGEFGVASCSSAAYFNGKVYAPFSARNAGSPSFNNRSIGLAFTSNPETLPWSKLSTPIIDVVGGEDDDPAIITIPGDDYIHCYARTAISGSYKIIHSKTKTPEIANSWSTPNDATNPIVGVAQEITSAFFTDGLIQMYVMEQGSQTGTAHLVSKDPDAIFSQAFLTKRNFTNISGIAHNGHISPIIKNYQLLGWTWTVLQDSSSGRYGVLGYLKKDTQTQINESLINQYYRRQGSLKFDGTNRVEVPANAQFQLGANTSFTWHFKLRLNKDRVLDSSTDQNCVFSLGNNVSGAMMINLRGSSTYKGCFFRFWTAVNTFIDVIPLSDVSSYFLNGKDVTITVVRQGANGNFILYINGDLIVNSPADSTIALTTSSLVYGALGTAQTIPFYGQLYESLLLNFEQTQNEIKNYHISADVSALNYVDIGGTNGILVHHKFNVYSKVFEDLGTQKLKATVINYNENQHVNLVKPYTVETLQSNSTATDVAGVVTDLNTLLQKLRDSQFFN